MESAQAARPDLILLTIELPRTNGFSVCNRLERDPDLRGVPLIILSSECSDETFEVHSQMKTAAEGDLHTPCVFDVLVAKVRELIPLTERAGDAGACSDEVGARPSGEVLELEAERVPPGEPPRLSAAGAPRSVFIRRTPPAVDGSW